MAPTDYHEVVSNQYLHDHVLPAPFFESLQVLSLLVLSLGLSHPALSFQSPPMSSSLPLLHSFVMPLILDVGMPLPPTFVIFCLNILLKVVMLQVLRNISSSLSQYFVYSKCTHAAAQ